MKYFVARQESRGNPLLRVHVNTTHVFFLNYSKPTSCTQSLGKITLQNTLKVIITSYMFRSQWIIIRELECLYMKLLCSSYLRCDVNSVVAACSDSVGYVVLG